MSTQPKGNWRLIASGLGIVALAMCVACLGVSYLVSYLIGTWLPVSGPQTPAALGTAVPISSQNVGRLEPLYQFAITETVDALAWSPDSRWLAIGSSYANRKGLAALIPEAWGNYSFHLWDVTNGNGRILYTSPTTIGGTTPPTSIVFVSEGDKVVFQTTFSTTLWDVRQGRALWTSTSDVQTLRELSALELATGQKLPHWDISKYPYAIWSSDWKIIAVSVYDETDRNNSKLKVFDVKSGNELWTMSELVHFPIVLSHNGKMLLSRNRLKEDNSSDSILLSDVESGQVLHQLEGTFPYRPSAAFSPDDTLVASAGSWGIMSQAYIWEVRSGRKYTLNTGFDKPGGVAFSPDSRFLAIGTDDGTVQVWGVRP